MAKRKTAQKRTRTVELQPGDVVLTAEDWKKLKEARRMLLNLARELKAR